MNTKVVRVEQLNCKKNRDITHVLQNALEADILLVQEPGLIPDPGRVGLRPISHPAWIAFHAEGEREEQTTKIRAVTYIKRAFHVANNIMACPDWTTNDMVTVEISGTKIVNVYNDRAQEEGAVRTLLHRTEEDERLGRIVIAGDFNLYHRMWQNNARTQHQQAEDLVEWMFEKELVLASPPNIRTHKAGNVLDLVLASPEVAVKLEFLDVADETGRDYMSEHYVQRWQLELVTEEEILDYKRYKYDKLDWEAFVAQLTEEALKLRERRVGTPHQIDKLVMELEELISRCVPSNSPLLRITAYSKRWWDEYLRQAHEEARRKRRTARVDPTEEHKEAARKATNDFHRLVKQKKSEHWNRFLEELKGSEIWKAHKYCKPSTP